MAGGPPKFEVLGFRLSGLLVNPELRIIVIEVIVSLVKHIIAETMTSITMMFSAGFTNRPDRLKPKTSNFGEPPAKPRCITFLPMLLDFHTYVVIAYCTF